VTKFDERTQDDSIEGLDTALASDLNDLYAAPVPALHFQRTAPAPQTGGLSQLLRRSWRPAAALGATAVAVAAVLVGPSLWNGESQVNAETIFARTSAAAQTNAPASGPQSYHLIATTESGGQSAATTTETWYVDSSHQRSENDWTGDGSADFGFSVDGADAWMYGDFSGAMRAVHGPASEFSASFGTQNGAASLGEVLGQYNGNCQKATQDGEETIAGRAAYRIVVTPDVDTCPTIAGEPGKDMGKLGTLIVDVDKETFLPLKTEQRGDGGLPAYTYEVTQIEVGSDIASATFSYTAPGGVTVQDVADLTQAKNVLSGYTPEGVPPAPVP
jgi:outer membrane lipoprotein-sorting protein